MINSLDYILSQVRNYIEENTNPIYNRKPSDKQLYIYSN